jgi:nucleoside-diphosphate-sugar epimerase
MGAKGEVMKVFVTGATGAIGRHAVQALVESGHAVTALARTPEKAASLDAQGATPVSVSIFDKARLVETVSGHDAIVNLATALPATSDFRKISAWAENIRIRTEGSATIVDAALEAGVPTLIQESVSMIYQDRGDQWIDETWPTDDFPMAQSNLAAEASANRFSSSGGTGVILRFGWFYGPGAKHSEEFLQLARKWGIGVMMGRSTTYVSSINVLDGGRAIAAALSVASGIYNIADDQPLTKREFADAIACAGGRKHYLRAPGRIAEVLGDSTTSLTRSLRVSNAKFKAATGWSPRFASAREGLSEMVQD